MSDTLKEICENKLHEIEQAKQFLSMPLVRALAEKRAPQTRGFINALNAKKQANRPALIAEVKRKSPSKGIIRPDFNHIAIAKSYESAGADCISVLTDSKYFDGKNEYLTEIRRHVSLPLLRKDFMLDEYQIYESRALGADCILLIMAALSDSQALELEAVSHALNMDVLIEVHDEAELERALKLKSPLLGINNRNLKTMAVSLETGRKLAANIPDSHIRVCESGISTKEDVLSMTSAGFHAFLIGESFMRQENIENAVKALIS